ncbi:MAG: metal ABC transporter ATP-binding protein [Candidatus Binataceae bacterium]
MQMTQDRILSVEHLFVTLDTKPILEDLSFAIERGENLCIIGPNGSGKTVLLKSLVGLISYTGTVKWASSVRMGYVPQKVQADRRLPITFRNLLASKSKLLGVPFRETKALCNDIGLATEILDTAVGVLSGGEFQRGLIAFALIGMPNVLLFDEPTASVDMPGEEHLYECIHRLQDDYKLTVITVSHDLSIVNKYASKVLCLNRRKIYFGPPVDALTPEVITSLYGVEQKYHLHPHNDD